MIRFLVSFLFFIVLFQVSADSLNPSIMFNFSFNNKGINFDGVSFSLGASETEAFYSFDKSKTEFCCDREYTSEVFYEMSETESNRIVENLLGTNDNFNNFIAPRPSPTKGQR